MERKEGKLEKRWLRLWNMNNWSNRCFVSCVLIVWSVNYAFVSRWFFLSFMYWLIPMDYNFSTPIRYQNWSTINASYAHSLAILAEGSILFPIFFPNFYFTWAVESTIFLFLDIFIVTALTSLSQNILNAFHSSGLFLFLVHRVIFFL